MAATTTRMPVGIEEINGNAPAATTTTGAMPVEIKNGAGDELVTDLTHLAGSALATPTTAGVLLVEQDQPVEIAATGNTVQISQTATQNGVDLVKINGTAPAAATTAGALLIGIDPNQNVVSTGAAGDPASDYQTGTALKNLGTAATLTFADITAAKTGRLAQIHFFSQTQMVIEIYTRVNTTNTLRLVTGTPAGGGPFTFNPDLASITQAGGTGQSFRVIATNLDKNKDADIHAWAEWSEV